MNASLPMDNISFNSQIYANTIRIIETSGVDEESVVGKLFSFANLPEGWNYGTGSSIPINTIGVAIKWYQLFLNSGLTDVDVFPGEDGAILIAVITGDYYIEAIIEADHSISLKWNLQNKPIKYYSNMSELVAYTMLMELIEKVTGEKWSSSDSSIKTLASTREYKGSTASHSGTLAKELLYYSQNALPMERYATISGTNIQKSQGGSHQYFGNSIETFCQLIAA